MKKISGLFLDQDDIATAVCEFVAKTYPEYADVQLEDVAFVTTEILDLGLSRVDVQVRMPKKDDTSDE